MYLPNGFCNLTKTRTHQFSLTKRITMVVLIELEMEVYIQVLLIPMGLNLHIVAEFQFCDFFPPANPSGVFWDFIV